MRPTHYTQDTLPRLIYHHDRFYRCYNKAKTIYQSGFVGQLERRWRGNGVVASVKNDRFMKSKIYGSQEDERWGVGNL